MSEGGGQASPIGQLSGQVIAGRYRLGELLGQGGMGVVYTATQESLARPVALKVLQPMLAQNGESILRFRAEAERAGRLAHPHIVQILDFGHEPNASAWIAMELLSGESLAARIERGPLSEAEVVRVARETLSALEAAHAAHLVHRDLKPDNIFLANVPGIGASVKVLDFGIAKLLDDESAGKLTATGMLIGTPLYMAPEQARGDDIDQRADLYALGAVLYEALTGRPPFTGKNYNALLFSVLSESPQPIESFRPDISPALAGVIAHAMAKNPAERFQSAHEMAEALRALAPSEHVPILRSSNDPAMGTAPTMATPVPNETSTPVLGGTGGASTPAGAGAGPSPAWHTGAAPLAATTPASFPAMTPPHAPHAPHAASAPSAPATGPMTPATSGDAKSQQGFRWWPIALAGGALAMASLAFVGANLMASQSAEGPVALGPSTPSTELDAPGASGGGAAELVPVTPAVPIQVDPGNAERVTTTSVPLDQPPRTGPTTGAPIGGQSADPQPSTDDELDAVDEGAGVSHRRRPRPTTGSSSSSEAQRTGRLPWVRLSGFEYRGMSSSNDLRGPIEAEGGWQSCWPRGVEAPTVNMGRAFFIDIAADGRALSAEVAPHSEQPPEFAECVVRKLRTLTFPPPVTGAQVRVRISFTVSGD